VRTTTLSVRSSIRVDAARTRVREGTRRFLLPFGIIGKDKSFTKALVGNSQAEPCILVIQDVRLLFSPEYIFSVEPGDCTSLHTLFPKAQEDFFKEVELAVSLYRPALVIVAASTESQDNSTQEVLSIMARVEKSCPLVKRWMDDGVLGVEGCLVDPKSRRTEFLGHPYFASMIKKEGTYDQDVGLYAAE
jgi:hypothetical protein